ncbi:hypothetical protein Ami103574_13095 [Aminipila butyrica]|uniref:Uncharacterized protein n=1 Tax=Aminipila butyrica TaxID=433296 RepID=A0A858BZ31_9FIRM|nr:hypothetical protein [Aminipila butyrica]QIB70170.1 hypothetical protein Ami103574_13095 [Aminipila butyrica]
MKLTFVRHLKLKKYTYESDIYRAEAEYTLGYALKKLTAFNKENEIEYELKQENWWLKVLTYIPFWELILGIGVFPPYKFYHKGIYCGRTRTTLWKSYSIIEMENEIYELYLHSNNYISILKNDVQSALVQKEELTVAERNTYHLNVDESLVEDINLMSLFIAFIDIVFFPQAPEFWLERSDKTIGPDKLYYRTRWKPESERGEESEEEPEKKRRCKLLAWFFNE